MALHIRDPKAEELVRELARTHGTTLTEAVKIACEEKLERDRAKLSPEAFLAEIRALPRTGEKADKAFFDQLWGEND